MTKKQSRKLVEEAKVFAKEKGFHILDKKDIKRFSLVAGEAYENYPMFSYVFNDKYSKSISTNIMETSIRLMLKEGIIYSDNEDINGFIIILPPTYKGIKAIPFLTKGGINIISKGGIGLAKRLLTYEDYAVYLRKKYTTENDWYIYNLTVSPHKQGKGIGKSLMKCILEFFDKNNINCYLETNKETNTLIYKSIGFNIVESGVIPNTKIPHYAMYRKANY